MTWLLDPGADERGSIWTSLSVRLGVLLSLAMIPLGLIALVQTNRLEAELAEETVRNLRAITVEVAEREREAIEGAFGAAGALGAAALDRAASGPDCSRLFRSFVDLSDGTYVFAGLMPLSGKMTCSSSHRVLDLSQSADFRALRENPRRRVTVNASAPMTGRAVVAVTEPVRRLDGSLAGFIIVSIPHEQVDGLYLSLIGDRPTQLVTLSQGGDVLTSSTPLDKAPEILPADRSAEALTRGGEQVFRARRADGTPAVYAVAPIVDGTIYAVGVWPKSDLAGRGIVGWFLSPSFFPLAMWLMSLVLVTTVVERQVVGEVRVLAAQMRRFARKRELPVPARRELPRELRVIDTEFRNLAEKLTYDEAQLLDTVHEKEVLIKEVHHRVKNNLQLISSIVNMQERRATDPATTRALGDISMRVTSMATVHRQLYGAQALSRVEADELLRGTLGPLLDLQPHRAEERRLTTETRFDPVTLYPDQALPVALLTVEAVTNAIKYASAPPGTAPWMRVSLIDEGDGDGTVTLEIANSIAPPDDAADAGGPRLGSGRSIGQRLIRSFARQLGSAPEIVEEEGSFALRVRFRAKPFDPEHEEPVMDEDGPHEAGETRSDAA